MQKNTIIAIQVVMIAGLAILWYRAVRFHKPAIEQISLAIEIQSHKCSDFASQSRWLSVHLEKLLDVLEAERGLEPIPSFFDRVFPPTKYSINETPTPFVVPYQKPEHRPLRADPNALDFDLELCKLAAMTNLNTLNAGFITGGYMEQRIDDYYQRLQRLEPMMEAAKK